MSKWHASNTRLGVWYRDHWLPATIVYMMFVLGSVVVEHRSLVRPGIVLAVVLGLSAVVVLWRGWATSHGVPAARTDEAYLTSLRRWRRQRKQRS